MSLLNFVERQKWWLCANLAFQCFYQRWSVSLICRIDILVKKLLKKGFIETPMGINKVSLRVFWFQKGYFVPNMTKIRFQKKTSHIFFILEWRYSVKLWQEISGFHGFGGGPLLSRIPLVSMKSTFGFQFQIPPKPWNPLISC